MRVLGGVAALLLALELASLLVAWILEGRLSFWSYWQRERDVVMRRFETGRETDRFSATVGRSGTDVVHPYVGYVGDPTVSHSVNELGFEGETDPVQKRGPNRLIVGVLGGSTAMDFAARGAEQLERRLATVPEHHRRELILINLARDGYKQPQQLMALSYVLSLGGQFDAVVNIDGLNEAVSHETGNAKKGVFPVYPRDWYLATSHVPDRRLRRLMGRELYLEGAMADLAAFFSRRPWRYSMVGNLLWRTRHRAIERRHEGVEHAVAAYRTAAEESVPYRTTGPRLRLSPQATYELLVDVWTRGSLLIDGLCRENGIAYLHFLQPGPWTDSFTITAEHAKRAALAREAMRTAGRRLQELGIAFDELEQPGSTEGLPAFEDGGRALDSDQVGLVAERLVESLDSIGSH